jgi:hypothetical protein
MGTQNLGASLDELDLCLQALAGRCRQVHKLDLAPLPIELVQPIDPSLEGHRIELLIGEGSKEPVHSEVRETRDQMRLSVAHSGILHHPIDARVGIEAGRRLGCTRKIALQRPRPSAAGKGEQNQQNEQAGRALHR